MVWWVGARLARRAAISVRCGEGLSHPPGTARCAADRHGAAGHGYASRKGGGTRRLSSLSLNRGGILCKVLNDKRFDDQPVAEAGPWLSDVAMEDDAMRGRRHAWVRHAWVRHATQHRGAGRCGRGPQGALGGARCPRSCLTSRCSVVAPRCRALCSAPAGASSGLDSQRPAADPCDWRDAGRQCALAGVFSGAPDARGGSSRGPAGGGFTHGRVAPLPAGRRGQLQGAGPLRVLRFPDALLLDRRRRPVRRARRVSLGGGGVSRRGLVSISIGRARVLLAGGGGGRR